jgi:hypothetical protein
MNSKILLEYQWPYLLSFLPPEKELEQTAKSMGALVRKRNIDSASKLLRLVFAYGFCGLSLRETAAWAEVSEIAYLSDVALMKRLRASSDWLGHLLAVKLAEKAPPPPFNHSNTRLRLVDATTISQPGSRGTNWRIHLGFNLAALRIDHIDLTDHSGGETLTRFPMQSGDLFIGDRGYAHRRGFYSVIQANADFIIRLNWQNVPLQFRSTGQPFDLLNALRGLPETMPDDFLLQVAPSQKDKIPVLPARLVAIRKSEAAAEAAREKILQTYRKKGRAIDPRTLESAGYIFLLTTLSPDQISTKDVLELYRFRWQIELAFKRMKSLLDLGNLPAKDPPLVRTYLYAKLLAALILEELTEEFLNFSPWGFRLA